MASVAISEPIMRRSALSGAQPSPTGWKPIGNTSRWAQLEVESGSLCNIWLLPPVPSTSCSPRGTTTSQQFLTFSEAPVPRRSPQPRCGASRAVCTGKTRSPVPSARVMPNSSSLVSRLLKYVKSRLPVVAGSPLAGRNGTKDSAVPLSTYSVSAGSPSSCRRATRPPPLSPFFATPNTHCSRSGPFGSSPQHCITWR